MQDEISDAKSRGTQKDLNQEVERLRRTRDELKQRVELERHPTSGTRLSGTVDLQQNVYLPDRVLQSENESNANAASDDLVSVTSYPTNDEIPSIDSIPTGHLALHPSLKLEDAQIYTPGRQDSIMSKASCQSSQNPARISESTDSGLPGAELSGRPFDSMIISEQTMPTIMLAEQAHPREAEEREFSSEQPPQPPTMITRHGNPMPLENYNEESFGRFRIAFQRTRQLKNEVLNAETMHYVMSSTQQQTQFPFFGSMGAFNSSQNGPHS